MTGLWKAGKTTLLAWLLRFFGDGGDLGGAIAPTQVLVVSEESAALWMRRRDELEIGDHVCVDVRPFLGRPTRGDWEAFIEHLAALVEADAFGLVVFDTLSSLWPVSDENDAAVAMAALSPLHRLTKVGAAVLLVHHPKKGDAGEGQAARGSGALPGFVDVIVELRRFAPQNREDRRRKLTAYSRFDETPGELVIELTDDRYRCVGTTGDATKADRMAVITDVLPTDGNGWTVDELREHWPENGVVKPSKRTVQTDLREGAQAGRWCESGKGHRGDPLRYSIRAASTFIGARNESKWAQVSETGVGLLRGQDGNGATEWATR